VQGGGLGEYGRRRRLAATSEAAGSLAALIDRLRPLGAVPLDPVGTAATEGATDQMLALDSGSPCRCRRRQRDGEPLLRDATSLQLRGRDLSWRLWMMVSTTLVHSAIHAADHLPDLESGPCSAGAAHRWDHPEDRAAVQ
jgi:hypothetical protein